MSNLNETINEITQKFGYFPLYFEPAKESNEILKSLWSQTKDNYLDSPLPALFKEKLALSITQFSSSPYSFMFHIANLNLIGMHANEIDALLKNQPKSYNELVDKVETVATVSSEFWPEEGSLLEYKIHLLSIAIFLDRDVHYCHGELRKILPLSLYNALICFINFKYTSLKWTEAHPEINYKEDQIVFTTLPKIYKERPSLKETLSGYLSNMKNQKALRNRWLKEENQKIFQIQENLINLSIKKEEELTTLLDAASEGMYGIDTQGRISFINKAALKILGYNSKTELIGKNAHESFHYKTKNGGHFPIEDCKIYQALRNKETIEISDDTLWTKDGHPLPVEYRSTPTYNNSKELTGSFVTFKDLTQEYKAKQQVKFETDRILSILDNAPIPLTIMEGPRHRVSYSNSKGPKYFQNRNINMIGKEILDIYPDFATNGLLKKLDHVFKTGETYFGQEVLINFEQADGTTKPYYLDVIYKPHYSSDGVIRGVLGVAINVTEKVSQRKELIHQTNEAKAASLTKNSFLANMSHEIRTPLNAIIGFTEVLQTSKLSKEEQDYLNIIQKNGTTLSKLIDDILDISKVEAGKLAVDLVPCDLIELIGETIEVFEVMAHAKDIQLKFTRPKETGFTIISDPTRLRQILTNLIGNAVKFTKQGSVNIRLAASKPSPGLTQFEIFIQDTGIGLSAPQIEKIFQPFVQADDSTQRIFGGTGLGLALSKRLAEALKGDIQVTQSEPNVGSTFCFNFQAKVESRNLTTKKLEPLNDLKSNPLKSMNILVVDDSKENRRLMKILLSGVGANVALADSGYSAIEKIITKSYDLVLLDIQMPGMDGYQTFKEIKERGFKKPIVALTAHAMTHEREKTKEHGFDGHETKPVDINKLVTTILELHQPH